MGTRLPTHRALGTRLTAVALALALYQLFALPLLLLPGDPRWGWTLVPLALLTTPFSSLIHEAVHGGLHPRRDRNDRLGRALSIGYGSPFGLLEAGHLLHHRYSRTRERAEVYDPARSRWAVVATGYYLRLFGGLYLVELAALLLALLPAGSIRALGRGLDAPDSVSGPLLERVAQPKVLREFRIDAAAIVALHALAFAAYGAHWWMLALALGGRALIVSLSDNAYHYGTDLDAPLEALNLRLPPALELLALGFNLHGLHHRRPGLRWYELRPAFDAEGGECDTGWFRAVGRQIRGPIAVPERAAAEEV